MSAFGIDLGTTNSVIAWVQAGVPRAIDIAGSPIVPSVVLYGDGKPVVGKQARNLALVHPERTVSSVKRSMGRSQSVAVAGQALRPEDVSAEILRALKVGAEQATGESVRDVVVTVPAYFDDGQRRATLQAAEAADLNVLRLLNEPTAASLVYDQVAQQGDEPHTVLVYDLGGGTFDVSVLDVCGDIREVKATTGDTHLGGDDFDRLLVGRFRDELQKTRGVDLRGDAVAMARLQRLAEETKIALSAALETRVAAEFLTSSGGKPVHLDFVLRRSEFEDLVRPHLQRTVDLAIQALLAANLTSVDRICLVGGSTRIPLVRQLLTDAFKADVHEEIDVDLAVGLGAALQAALLEGQPVERILVDVTAHDLGILALDYSNDDEERFSPVIHRNTVLPTRREREFYTVTKNQPSILVEVYQGNAPQCAQNRKIGEFTFTLSPVPEGSPVRVAFEYDPSGLVRVTVVQVGTTHTKTVALRVADAAEPAAAQAAPVAASTVQRKAEALRERLKPAARAKLDALLAAYLGATGSAREAAEEDLLDFFVDHDEPEDGDVAP